MKKTYNNLVACSAFPKQNMERVVKSGIAMIDKKVQLQDLNVALSATVNINGVSCEINPGTKIWVRGDQVTMPWAKEVYSVDGLEVILVPASAIQILTVE